MQVTDSIRHFLSQELRIPDALSLAPELPLLQKGVIDSIELMQVAAFVEKEFGIVVDETEVVPSNFRSLAAMTAFVERKRAAI